MGLAQGVDGMGAGHPGWKLHPQHGCGGVQGVFHDALDPQQQTKVDHFMTMAQVPDCIDLLPFEQLQEAFNSYTGAATTVGLVQMHRSNAVFPDVYFQYYGEHFTIMGLFLPGNSVRFQHVRVRTEATFAELNANLPSLLCRFVTPDQAGHILASIFTCLCNYNTEICGMAMTQTVVPVYTIPNTYRVQQSLWESMCWIIPGIARTNEGELRSFQPAASRNMSVGQSGTVLVSGGSGNRGTVASQLGNPQSMAASSIHWKGASQDTRPDGITPANSKWSFFHQYVPTVDLTTDGDPPDARPQGANTPITTALVPERRHSAKKINISKVKASHLIFDMQDWQERARKSTKAGNQAAASEWTSVKECGSSGGFPHGLPATLANLVGEELPTIPSDPTPEAHEWGTKRPHDDEVTEIPDEDEPAGSSKKKKKKKKSKDTSKDEVPLPGGPEDGSHPSTSTAKPTVDAEEPMPVPDLSGVPEEEDKISKKKKKKHKKKEAGLEKLKLEEQEAKAKEMAKATHRPIQRRQDFRDVRDYRKSLPEEILETINGEDHSGFLLEKLKKEGNYMSWKSGHKRNLMLVIRLLSRIAKHVDEMPPGGTDHHQIHLPNGAGDACRRQVFPGIGSASTDGLLWHPHRL